MTNDDSLSANPAGATGATKPGWLLTAFLIYFLLIAAVITLFILIAWKNG